MNFIWDTTGVDLVYIFKMKDSEYLSTFTNWFAYQILITMVTTVDVME